MVIIEIQFKKLEKVTMLKHKILSSSEISPSNMIEILNIFQSISDDILSISEDTYIGSSSNNYIAIVHDDYTHFSSHSFSHINFSFIYDHSSSLFEQCIKVKVNK